MTIQEVLSFMAQIAREGMQASDETGLDIHLSVNRVINSKYFNDNSDPTERHAYLDFGDYEVWFDGTIFQIVYQPENGTWDYHVEPDQIKSFVLPPDKESPAASENEQGMSVDEIAHHHFTLSEGKENEDVLINI